MKSIRKAFLFIFLALLIASFTFIVILFVGLFEANTKNITDETAYHLLDYYFKVDLDDCSTIIYKTYGTNIREEFFTIAVLCGEAATLNSIMEKAVLYIPIADIDLVDDLRNNLPKTITGFYCLYQWNELDIWTHRILVSDDKTLMIFEYDP